MNERTAIRGQRIRSVQSFPERPYRYNGDQPYIPSQIAHEGKQCLVEGCGTKRHSSDYCERHYRNFKVYGTPHVPDRRRKENRGTSNGS